MKRQIIVINEEKCTGCGVCVPDCPEGALQIIDGKARLVGELLCDGLGACIGQCPEGALTVEMREAEAYDEYEAMKNVVQGGESVIRAHLKHLDDHKQDGYLAQAKAYLKENNIPEPTYKDGDANTMACGCPGTMMKDFREATAPLEESSDTQERPSALQQWPIQLTLLNPHAPYFENADIVVAADCVPFTHANFHARFLKNKALIMFCPKLDSDIEGYVNKLTSILKDNTIKSITIVHMEVPCCTGTVRIVEEALKRSEENIPVKDYTISVRGNIV